MEQEEFQAHFRVSSRKRGRKEKEKEKGKERPQIYQFSELIRKISATERQLLKLSEEDRSGDILPAIKKKKASESAILSIV